MKLWYNTYSDSHHAVASEGSVFKLRTRPSRSSPDVLQVIFNSASVRFRSSGPSCSLGSHFGLLKSGMIIELHSDVLQLVSHSKGWTLNFSCWGGYCMTEVMVARLSWYISPACMDRPYTPRIIRLSECISRPGTKLRKDYFLPKNWQHI